MRWAILVSAVLILGAHKPTSIKADLVFLTRPECVISPDMMFNLDDALHALGWSNDYQSIDIATLKKTDVRAHYPTPTLLWKGKDIFGMPAPDPSTDTPG